MVFTIFPEYKNERYNIEIYNTSGVKVASASSTYYNSSIMYKTVTITVNTSELKNMTPGNYTVKYWLDFYSMYEWHSAPNSYTRKLTVLKNVCNGNHRFVQDSIYTEPTCKKEGVARMVCSTCGHTVYQSIPVSGHTWDGGTVTTDPTDTETGIRTYTCTVCSETKTESIPALVTAPAKPYKIANVVSGIHVYWDAVEGAHKYGLWRSETGKDGTYNWIANPTTNHFTDTKIESGKTYFYKVTILNTDLNVHTDKSEAIGVTYVATPDITSRTNTAAGVKMSWDKITGATGYAIYRKSYSGTDAWVRVGTISGNSTFTWTDTSVKNNNGEVYKYTIRALAGSDMKTLSGCRNAGRTMVRLSSQVLTSATKASSTSVLCKWTASSKVTGYEIRFLVNGEVYKTFTVGNYKTGTKTFTGLKAGQTYTVQVRTYKKVDGVGSFYSDWSTAKTVKI
ncbi:fibronectin type III domain-containing protein [Anaeromassilibacillus senegalensis]|uniref:Fibronectin type III domain-containing protein n=1 Tax=Anaeromassilibacillus senegalensis TaxID=1673717 RepID=A0ABS9CPZ0_9FIRM|nr:fibronectin type III domain-containing protein [Anaeromassilibacillus senegalensis]MCF2653211.1 fibronectin type III domain-containing protein [Anaeromassilibacillus senegalensis]